MDSIFQNEDEIRNTKTRWDQIEKRHINSATVYDRSDAATKICNDLIQNKEFINGNNFKVLLGETPKRLCLDPNLVMDLRHSKFKKRIKSATPIHRQRAKSFVDERMNIQKMFELNHEIQKYKKCLENFRPKTSELKNCDSNANCYTARSLNSLRIDVPCPMTDDDSDISLHNFAITEIETVERAEIEMAKASESVDQHEIVTDEQKFHEDQEQSEKFTGKEIDDNQIPRSLTPLPILSQFLIDESYTSNGIDVENVMETQELIGDSIAASECSSTRTVHMPMSKFRRSNDDFELIIKPTIMVNIQEAIRPDYPHKIDYGQSDFQSKLPDFHREKKIAVNQHMSIFIKNLSNGVDGDKLQTYMSESLEGNDIIREVFNKKSQDNFLTLQKCFLRWVHFNTIEKLKRQNPGQTRLQKMESFLRNITLERKRALNKLRRPGQILTAHHGEDHRRMVLHDPTTAESPRLLMRTYNNKLKTQQDIIELQKIKLQRQQRIITELKLSKLLEDTNEAENHLREELELVARNGYANSRSKAKCLQIAGNLKDKDDKETQDELQAKGITAPKFLIEMQARALERAMRHQEAQRRREDLAREKEAMRLAAEEEKRLLDEETKRERIKQYWRKRREERELEEKKALDRMRFLANLERAKIFHQIRLLKYGMRKFKNLIKWKNRNKKVCMEFYRRIYFRDHFVAWRNFTAKIWQERKAKAEACHNLHCKMLVWSRWQEVFLVTQSKKILAEDWYHLRLSEQVFRAWARVTAQTRMIYELKQRHAEAHFNWYMKWKVLEHWRRLHAILKIEKETEARRDRWRSKVYELIPDYKPNIEFI